MTGAAERRIEGVRALMRTLSDAQLARLESALVGAAQSGAGELLSVLDAVGAEMVDRRAASLALGPLLPLFRPPSHALATLALPEQTVRLFWADTIARDPDGAKQACAEVLRLRGDDAVPSLFDDLCRAAAERVRAGEGALAAAGGADAAMLADVLTLAPLARNALAQLGGWLGRPSGEEAAQARLAFRDAGDLVDEGGPLLLRILNAHLDEPWGVLRLIAVMADRPTDRFLADSELAVFGEGLLLAADERIAAVRRFDADGGAAAGEAAAEALKEAASILAEFELRIQLRKDGPWGPRVAAAKRAVAAAAELRLRELEGAVGAAFPLQPARIAKRFLKGVPKLAADPDPRLVRRAEASAAFLAGTRSIAAEGGFGASRAKVLDKLEERLADYVEDLLETVHGAESDIQNRARTYLDAVGGLIGWLEGDRSAEVVRRRAAAA